VNRLIEGLVTAATDTAFRSVEVRRPAPEPGGAVLVIANHGGGLGDILTVIAGCRRFPRFLARDIIWKFPIARQIVNAVAAIPVSRRQDHGDRADNTSMFSAAYQGLADGDLLVIYPEGESVAEPRLAPLRTGAARILLGAWAQGIDTTILPMGLHYYDISVLRGRCLVEVGELLRMSDVVADLPAGQPLTEHNQPAVHALTDILASHLSAVVAEYSDWQTRRDLESAAAIYLMGRPGAESVSYSDMATTADRIGQTPTAAQEQVITDLKAYSAAIELLGLSDHEIPDVAMTGVKVAGRAAGMLSLLPFAAYGTVVNGVPMAGLRLISLTGVAPATAATLKPRFRTDHVPRGLVPAGLVGIPPGRRAGRSGDGVDRSDESRCHRRGRRAGATDVAALPGIPAGEGATTGATRGQPAAPAGVGGYGPGGATCARNSSIANSVCSCCCSRLIVASPSPCCGP